MTRGTALVTGASSGIGAAIARCLSEEGFDLVITARRLDKLEALAAELTTSVTVVSADLSEQADVDRLIETTETEVTHPINVLVNNAGADLDGEFLSANWEDIQKLLTTNITSLTQLTHHYAPGMVSAGAGRILNVASVAAFHPVPGMDLYAASKAYVLSLSESLSESLRGTGVSVTALCPGLTSTDMARPDLLELAPPQLVSDPDEVAREGIRAMLNREAICIPGPANKLALTWAQHQPRWLVRNLGGFARKLTRSR